MVNRTPVPLGAPSLCPEMLRASTPSALTSSGNQPAACTASVWNGTPCSRATAAKAAMGWTVPTSLFAYMMLTRAVSGPYHRAQAINGDHALPVHRHHVHGESVDPLQVAGGFLHCGMLDRADHYPVQRRVRRLPGQRNALDGQVVRFRAAGGEGHLAGTALQDLRDAGTGPGERSRGRFAQACGGWRGCRTRRSGTATWLPGPRGGPEWWRRRRGRSRHAQAVVKIDVQPEVEGADAVGQAADGDDVHAGGGNLGDGVDVHVAAGLHAGPAVHLRDPGAGARPG